jgi:hypothetical protein
LPLVDIIALPPSPGFFLSTFEFNPQIAILPIDREELLPAPLEFLTAIKEQVPKFVVFPFQLGGKHLNLVGFPNFRLISFGKRQVSGLLVPMVFSQGLELSFLGDDQVGHSF